MISNLYGKRFFSITENGRSVTSEINSLPLLPAKGIHGATIVFFFPFFLGGGLFSL